MAKITSEAFAQALHDAGVIGDLTGISRVIIDAQAGHVLKVLIEECGTDAVLSVAPLIAATTDKHVSFSGSLGGLRREYGVFLRLRDHEYQAMGEDDRAAALRNLAETEVEALNLTLAAPVTLRWHRIGEAEASYYGMRPGDWLGRAICPITH